MRHGMDANWTKLMGLEDGSKWASYVKSPTQITDVKTTARDHLTWPSTGPSENPKSKRVPAKRGVCVTICQLCQLSSLPQFARHKAQSIRNTQWLTRHLHFHWTEKVVHKLVSSPQAISLTTFKRIVAADPARSHGISFLQGNGWSALSTHTPPSLRIRK